MVSSYHFTNKLHETIAQSKDRIIIYHMGQQDFAMIQTCFISVYNQAIMSVTLELRGILLRQGIIRAPLDN